MAYLGRAFLGVNAHDNYEQRLQRLRVGGCVGNRWTKHLSKMKPHQEAVEKYAWKLSSLAQLQATNLGVPLKP